VDAGTLLVMPDQSATHVGVKVVSLAPGNPGRGLPAVQGSYLLLSADTLSPLAIMDAGELTLVRTPALSLLAVLALAPVANPAVVVIGTGPQAVAHAAACQALLDPVSVVLSARSASSAARAVGLLALRGTEAVVAVDPPLEGADIVICCTASPTPVVAGERIGDRAVVVAMGSHAPANRELDTVLMDRAFVVVESRDVARAEAGTVIGAEADLGRPVIAADLGEVVRGEVGVPADRPRVFASVGEAWEDLAVAADLAGG
jgi:ornithine cyclodeaminase/alanine dehydrogenase-like protein (mu-crystallin family)